MTAPHQDARIEAVIREGTKALAEAATTALPGILRPFVKREKLAKLLEDGVRELLGKLGVVTGKVDVTVAPGVKVGVKIRD